MISCCYRLIVHPSGRSFASAPLYSDTRFSAHSRVHHPVSGHSNSISCDRGRGLADAQVCGTFLSRSIFRGIIRSLPPISTLLFVPCFCTAFSSHHTRTLRGTWPRLARGSQIITVLQPRKTSGRAERGERAVSQQCSTLSLYRNRGGRAAQAVPRARWKRRAG